MPEANKRQVLKREMRKQGFEISAQNFVEQMTAFYERQISNVLSTADASEKILALKNIQEGMRGYINENDRVLIKRAEMKLAEAEAGIAIANIETGSGVVVIGALAANLVTGGIATIIVAGVAGIVYLAGFLTLNEKEGADKYKALAEAENAALTTLSDKVQQEMISIAGQTPVGQLTKALSTLDNKLQDSFKEEATRKPVENIFGPPGPVERPPEPE